MIATVSSSRSPSVDIPRVAPDRMIALGAAGLAAQIRSGDLSATEVVEAHIARIEQVDTTLNAVVVRRFDDARAEAARLWREDLVLAPMKAIEGAVRDRSPISLIGDRARPT